MRITAFDFCAPVDIVCVIMSCWKIDIESLSAIHDKTCTVRKIPYLAGFEPSSLACKAKLQGQKKRKLEERKRNVRTADLVNRAAISSFFFFLLIFKKQILTFNCLLEEQMVDTCMEYATCTSLINDHVQPNAKAID